MKTILRFLTLILGLFAGTNLIHAQGTAFTYQGRLQSGTNVANGKYDVAFSLFTASSGGVASAGPVTNAAVGVTNGLFSTVVNFGNVFTGGSNWLEIAVSTNAANAFSILAPRQQLTPVPYAIYAAAANATNLAGTINTANLPYGLGGVANTFTPGVAATIAGGNNNTASGVQATVGGGVLNVATGFRSTVPGGLANTASGDYSFAAGNDAQATNTGAFVWADSQNGFFRSTNNDSFNIRAQGGAYFMTGSGGVTVNGLANGVGGGSSIDPSVFVHVNNSATDGNGSSPDYAGIGFGNNSTRQAIVGGTFGADYLDFYTGGLLTSPKMRIDFNGSVGIGVTAPSAALTIGTSAAVQFELLKPGKNPGYQFNVDTAGFNICERNIACGRFFIANGTGNIGIGTTSPTNKLDVQGSADFIGRVGVGTSSPMTDFHVLASQYGALPAAIFESVNCGAACGQQNYQENIRLLNSNPNGQTGIGFLTATGSALTNTPSAWIGTQYGCCIGNPSDLKFATRPTTNLIDRLFINGISGNVGIGTNSPSTKLEVAGEVTCVAVNITSDRNAKEEFKPVNPREVLAKVVGLPITEWQYKSQADARHIGPMAQDFREAFTLGHDEKHIATVDEGGVALAAIQGLNQKLEEKDARIQELEKSVAELKTLVNQLVTQPRGGAK